jgi:hypothetical protein
MVYLPYSLPLLHARVSVIICQAKQCQHLLKERGQIQDDGQVDGLLTEAPLLITRTLPPRPVDLLLRTMYIRIMFVPHLFEEVNFILGGKEPDAEAVYGSVTPSLKRKARIRSAVDQGETKEVGDEAAEGGQKMIRKKYLVIESAFRVKILKESRVNLPSPIIHISDFKVTPDYRSDVGQ